MLYATRLTHPRLRFCTTCSASRGCETILDHLEGYEKSKPVRIGNDAHDQHKLDIYGEVLVPSSCTSIPTPAICIAT
jgi:hypothetical protein